MSFLVKIQAKYKVKSETSLGELNFNCKKCHAPNEYIVDGGSFEKMRVVPNNVECLICGTTNKLLLTVKHI